MRIDSGGGSSVNERDAAAAIAAAAARAKAEAEARARRMEEARKRAEAAREARRAAAEAQKKAREAIREAAEARKKLAAAKAKLTGLADAHERLALRRLPSADKAGKALTAANKEIKTLTAESKKLTAAAQAERRTALTAAKKTLTLQLQANKLFVKAGGSEDKVPFRAVAKSKVNDLYDAGSLSAADQEAIFGAKTVVRTGHAAQADANKVLAALEQGPEEAARVLREQLEGNTDEKYRAKLIEHAAPYVRAMGAQLSSANQCPSPDAVKGTLEELSLAAKAVPDAAPALAAVFASEVRDVNGSAQGHYASAISSLVKGGTDARFSAAFAAELRADAGSAKTFASVESALREAVKPPEKKDDNGDGVVGFFKDRADDVGEFVGDKLEDVGNFLSDAKKNVEEFLDDSGEVVSAAASGLRDGAIAAAKKGAELVDLVKDGFGVVAYHDDIDGMGKRDRLTFKLGVEAKLGMGVGGEVHADGEVEVLRQDDGTFRLSMEANAGGGVLAEAGAKLGPAGAKASAKATLTAGARVEMTFATAEEAKAAMDTLTVAAMGGKNSPTGMLADHAMGLNPKDLDFLKDNISAIELHGDIGVQAGAFLGIKGPPVFAGAFGSADASLRGAARIEFKKDGSPPDLVFRQEGRAKVMAGVGFGAGVARSPGGFIDKVNVPLASGQVRGKTMVRLEERFTLPANVGIGDLLSDPAGTAQKFATQIKQTGRAQLMARAELEDGAYLFGGKGANGVRGEITVDGKLEDLLSSGAITDVAKGDFVSAGKKLGDDLDVNAYLREYTRKGLDQNIGASVMGTGLDIDIEATNTDLEDKALWSFDGTASEAASSIQRFIQGDPREVRQREMQSDIRRHRTLGG